ncbi:hypothetical protein [Haloarchaeobius amylolyticus]|uniref:hypothetical protein n=1 Tax=Haloarchaeobius amylolyticus TaxID=1198296 RepID=UPI00227069EC|nr:hypothetical protein [Haloarchaeobius amylolyticus]
MSRARYAALLAGLGAALTGGVYVTDVDPPAPAEATNAATQPLAGADPLFVLTVTVWCLAGLFTAAVMRLEPTSPGDDSRSG